MCPRCCPEMVLELFQDGAGGGCESPMGVAGLVPDLGGGLWAPLPGSARGCVGIGFLGAWSLREAELFPAPAKPPRALALCEEAGGVRGSEGGLRGRLRNCLPEPAPTRQPQCD